MVRGIKKNHTDPETRRTAIRSSLETPIRLNQISSDCTKRFEALIENHDNGSRNIGPSFEERLRLSYSLDDEQKRHVHEHRSKGDRVHFELLTRPAPESRLRQRT